MKDFYWFIPKDTLIIQWSNVLLIFYQPPPPSSSPRVKAFESAMRASAGLRPLDTEPAPMFPSPRLGSSPARVSPQTPPPKKKSGVKRKSSLGESLKRVSAARGVPVAEILAEQGVAASPAEGRRGPVIRRSPGAEKVQLNNSRAPAGKVGISFYPLWYFVWYIFSEKLFLLNRQSSQGEGMTCI